MPRDTSYTTDVIDQAKDYVENFKDYGHAMPSVVGFCKVIGRSRSTLYNWADPTMYPDIAEEFGDSLEMIKEVQELVLFNHGLKGDYNSTIVKLALAKHGYHDKQDNTLSGPNGDPVEITAIERTIVKAPDSDG